MPPALPAQPACPVSVVFCPVLKELERLREECQRLLALSNTDPLTGLFNWRHLMSRLDREMERTRRTGLPTSLIMIDLDHFKWVNDTYGHQFGDAVLRWASRLFKGNTRRLDIPCRYGGEEFAIILPGTRLDKALRLAERLRKSLAQRMLKVDGRALSITASFGVDVYTAQEKPGAEAFLQRADQLLLEAKGCGRNLVRHRGNLPCRADGQVTAEEKEGIFPHSEAYENVIAAENVTHKVLPHER